MNGYNGQMTMIQKSILKPAAAIEPVNTLKKGAI
jgi:hypothetical protein